MSNDNSQLRKLPSVDLILREASVLVEEWGREPVTAAIREELANLRSEITKGKEISEDSMLTYIVDSVSEILTSSAVNTLVPVFNLTGTVLHTNLGRALLPESALEAVMLVSRSASSLEYDLESGERGDRDVHVEQLLCELTGAEAATVVNNNAAAVLLTLNTLAKDKEVPVSRGELVEIGGAFRMPEIITSAGCRLVEIGTTNRTHLRDYENVINDGTAMLLKVHTSNYRIEGFTSAVTEPELAQLAKQRELPFCVDLGSGNLIDFSTYGLPDEPTVGQVIANGVDVVTFSGDKLLGGPQCGMIVGRKDLIARIKKNPLKRALRLDKMTLSALSEVLRLYQSPSQLADKLPTLALLTRSQESIQQQVERILSELARVVSPHYQLSATDCFSQVGSGSLPGETIPSYALSITATDSSDQSLGKLATAWRSLPIPVIGRIHKGAFLLDLRCLEDEASFIQQLDKLGELLT